MCVCDLDVEPYILFAIFIALSPAHIYAHLTLLCRLIDSILNHITSITNCFIVPLHLSTHREAMMCVSACVKQRHGAFSPAPMLSAYGELKHGWRRVLELKD